MSLTTADLGRLADVQRQLMHGRPLDFQTSTWLADVVDTILSPPAEARLGRVQRAERDRLIKYLRSGYYPGCSARAAARAILADAARQRRTRGPAITAHTQLLRALNRLGPLPKERQLRKILRVGTADPY